MCKEKKMQLLSELEEIGKHVVALQDYAFLLANSTENGDALLIMTDCLQQKVQNIHSSIMGT